MLGANVVLDRLVSVGCQRAGLVDASFASVQDPDLSSGTRRSRRWLDELNLFNEVTSASEISADLRVLIANNRS